MATARTDAPSAARARQPYLAYVPQNARGALNPHETVRRTLTRSLTTAARRGRPDPDSDR